MLNTSSLGQQDKDNKTVLILHSFGSRYPAVIIWEKGIRSVLDTQEDISLSVSTEHLDLSRYNDPEYFEMMVEILRHKYSEYTPDLIITVFEPAFDFVVKYGDEVFPEVPVVFGGVEQLSIETHKINSNFTGVFHGLDSFRKTLDMALKLHPETRQAVVVSGKGFMELSWLKPAKITFKQYEDRLDFKYLLGLPVDDIKRTIEELPSNTLVFYIPVLEDNTGKSHIAIEVLSQISEVSSVPIYSFWEVFVGAGVVGGFMNNFRQQAIVTAEIGLKILKGTPVSNIAAVPYKDLKFLFDWRQLQRWSISEDKLPPGSGIRFREFTFLEENLGKIVLIAVLLIIQMMIITYLLIQRRLRRQSQIKLAEAEQKYRTVADYTYDWEYWQNPDGSLQYVSPSCERICGYNSIELMEKPTLVEDIVIPEDKYLWDKHKCNNQNEKTSEVIQYRIRRPDGEIRWIEHSCQSVIDSDGNNLGIRASNRDITEKERYKSETNQLQSDLTHMERIVTVSALSYALAHEINQPLTSIRSYAQAALRFMDKGQLEDKNVRSALNGIVRDNKRAASIVNHLRNLVKKESGHFEVIEINSIIKSVLELVNSEIVLRNCSINVDLDSNVETVQGDPIQIQQVLINLISNALDSLENEPIENRVITVSSKPANSDGIIVSISDTGNGIPDDKLNEIFNPFLTTKTKGLGLGLAICKSIVENHEGKIWAENNPGGGAVFSVILPTSINS